MFNEIQKLTTYHFELLLEADPSQQIVEDYTTRGVVFEVLQAQQLVGIVVLLPTRPETIEIVNIAVHPNFQNQGIGQEIIKFSIQTAKDKQYHTLEIGTGSTSLAQLYLYQKMNFRITGVDRDFFLRHYPEEIIENGLILKDMIRLQQDL
ncbi:MULTISPECIES: GNAT family N-acetyltransferase [Vagococcus]|uniref:GNAT family N-acetyltransferase n=1 Tax=Vagococcus TaxID=2737 RepID=UPI0015C59D6D|nr:MULTISPECIES: GNAT family N-acetyltransferase [Vagococcus]